MTVQYLIDSENVGDFWIPLLDLPGEKMELVVFYTRNSPHMSYDSLIKLKESDRKVTFIKCYEGTNALDFQLVSELGYRICDNEDGRFVIVTNDTGFDAAVKYWRRRKKTVKRITGKECRNLERRNREDFSPERAQLQTAAADEVPEKTDMGLVVDSSSEGDEQEGRSSRPNLRDTERALSPVLEDENYEEGLSGTAGSDACREESELPSYSLEEEDAEADSSETALSDYRNLSEDDFGDPDMEDGNDRGLFDDGDDDLSGDSDGICQTDENGALDSEKDSSEDEDSEGAEDRESFADADSSSDEDWKADFYGDTDTARDIAADAAEPEEDRIETFFTDADNDSAEDMSWKTDPDPKGSEETGNADSFSENNFQRDTDHVPDVKDGSIQGAGTVSYTGDTSNEDDVLHEDADLEQKEKEPSAEDKSRGTGIGDLAAEKGQDQVEAVMAASGDGAEQADEDLDESASDAGHHQRSRRSRTRRSKSGTKKTEQASEPEREEETSRRRTAGKNRSKKTSASENASESFTSNKEAEEEPSAEGALSETSMEAPSEEEIARIAACIGADNLAELHNQLAAFYGEQGKEIYLSIRKNPKSIPVLKADLRQKYAWYCEIIFSRSDYTEEYPKDLPDYLLGVREKLNSLNSLRYALLKQYGKEKGRRFYYLLKPYAKTMYQM